MILQFLLLHVTEKIKAEKQSKAKVHIALSYHKAQGTLSFQNVYMELIVFLNSLTAVQYRVSAHITIVQNVLLVSTKNLKQSQEYIHQKHVRY